MAVPAVWCTKGRIMTASRQFLCARCDAAFNNPAARGKHIRAHHPDYISRPMISRDVRHPIIRKLHGSLKRPSDAWPGRP